MDFIYFQLLELEGYLKEAGCEKIETTVRQPYAHELNDQNPKMISVL